MSWKAGYVGTGAKFYSLDEASVIAGRTFEDIPDVFYPDDSPSEHDRAPIDYLEEKAA